jgi:glycosyltransferase involved in cell wall biosynthesis
MHNINPLAYKEKMRCSGLLKFSDAKITVGVNARYLAAPLSGIERYLMELMKNTEPSCCQFKPYHLSPTPQATGLRRKSYQIRNALWDRFMSYMDTKIEGVDLFHAPSFVAPKMRSAIPTVVTVHDLAFMIHPEFFDRQTLAYLKFFFPTSIREAERIICISQNTADDLIHFFPSVKNRVRVVHMGYTNFLGIDLSPNILERLRLVPEQYMLCVGAFNARKNINSILDLAPRLIKAFPELRIVVVGRLPQDINKWTNFKNICFTGQISDQELATLYRYARLFVYPSRYEGFGFPILEAMSVGTPVACSHTSCMPEISGLGQENFFDPMNSESMYLTIASLLEAGRSSFNSDAAAASLARYSWKKMCDETIAVYRECVN